MLNPIFYIMTDQHVGRLEESEYLLASSVLDEENLAFYISELSNSSSKDIKSLKSDSSKVIARVFADIRKLVCPERRHWILSQRSVEGQLSVLIYLRSITQSHLTCDAHPSQTASEVEVSKFTLLCSECSSSTSSEKLSLSHSDGTELLEFLQALVRNSDHSLLNKFHLRTKRVSSFKNLAVLIHEIKFLMNKDKVGIPRCHICMKKLSFGAGTPVLLNCGHALCFLCYTNENYEECLIDRETFKDAKTLDININLYQLACHAEGRCNLLNRSGNIYKLPCMHKSCEGCLSIGVCKRCGCEFNAEKLRIDVKSMHIVEYLMLKCDLHNEIAISFDFVSFEAKCRYCGIDNEEACKDFTMVHWALELALKENLELFKLKKNDARTMIYTLHYKVIQLNEVKKIVLNYMMRRNNKSSAPVQEIIRFSKLLTQKSITKCWEIEENNPFGVHIEFKQKMLIHGIIFGESIRKTKSNGFRSSACPIIKFSLFSPTKNKLKCSYLLSAHAENNMYKLRFPCEIKVSENKKYKILMQTKNYFVHGLPYSIQKNNYFTIERLHDGLNNHAIGGPILGFIISEFKLLV